MVDVPGGAYRERHARTASATSAASASVSVRQSRSVRPSRTTRDHRRVVGAQRRRQLLLDRAGVARELGERERAAADAGDRFLHRAADGLRKSLGAGADGLGRLAQHAQHRDLLRPVEVERERSLERGERELVGAERALERVAPQPLDQLGAAHDDPRLRPAEQLVAREADEVGAGGEARGWRRLTLELDERAGAEVVDERQPRHVSPPAASAASRGLSVNPTWRKFD